MTKRLAAAALTLLMLTGCAGPEKDAEYENINELGKAYTDAVGGECRGNDDAMSKHGWLQDQCGPTGIVMMFPSDEARERIKDKNPLEDGRRWVQGKNWLIEADQYDAEKAHAALGGELINK